MTRYNNRTCRGLVVEPRSSDGLIMRRTAVQCYRAALSRLMTGGNREDSFPMCIQMYNVIGPRVAAMGQDTSVQDLMMNNFGTLSLDEGSHRSG